MTHEPVKERALFDAIKITKVKLYQESNTLEVFGASLASFDNDIYPPLLKFIYKGNNALDMSKKIVPGLVVHIEAKVEPYIANVYGKRGLPLHYPDGKLRKTTKVRFRILTIYRGVKVGRWRI